MIPTKMPDRELWKAWVDGALVRVRAQERLDVVHDRSQVNSRRRSRDRTKSPCTAFMKLCIGATFVRPDIVFEPSVAGWCGDFELSQASQDERNIIEWFTYSADATPSKSHILAQLHVRSPTSKAGSLGLLGETDMP